MIFFIIISPYTFILLYILSALRAAVALLRLRQNPSFYSTSTYTMMIPYDICLLFSTCLSMDTNKSNFSQFNF